MTSVGEMLADPAVAGCVETLTDASGDRPVRSVGLIDDIDEIGPNHAGAFLLLTRAGSGAVSTYRFDVGVRRAAENDVSVLVLGDPGGPDPMQTARAIAARADIALLRLSAPATLADLLAAAERVRAGGTSAALSRAAAVVEEIDKHEATGPDVDELIAAVRAVSGLDIARSAPGVWDHGVELMVDGESHGWLRCPRTGEPTDVLTYLLLHRIACSIIRRLGHQHRLDETPVRSRADLLAELLLRSPDEAAAVVHRARRLGIPIDGWHVASRLELANIEALTGDDEVRHHEVAQRLTRAALHTVEAAGGSWHHASMSGAIMLLRSYSHDPGTAGVKEVATVMSRVLNRLRDELPRLDVVCGVGTPHSGAEGLRASAAEARTVAAAHAGQHSRVPRVFDAVGLRRLILQWHALDDARLAARQLLAPIDRLEAHKGRELLRTLQAYLDAQGSVSEVAESLHLHRNTVTQRLRRIVELLDVDLDDPDQRLALHLACRARALEA